MRAAVVALLSAEMSFQPFSLAKRNKNVHSSLRETVTHASMKHVSTKFWSRAGCINDNIILMDSFPGLGYRTPSDSPVDWARLSLKSLNSDVVERFMKDTLSRTPSADPMSTRKSQSDWQ